MKFVVRALALLVALAVAAEAASFALFLQGIKAVGRAGVDLATVETRLWIAVVVACLAWVAAVKLAARLLSEVRAWRWRAG